MGPVFHSVEVFFLPRGPGAVAFFSSSLRVALFCRCRGAHLQAWAPPRPAPADSSARDRRARSAPGPLGVRKKPRRRLPSTARASGARGLRRDRPPAAPAHWKPALPNNLSIVLLGGGRDPPGGWGGHRSGGHGVPSVRIRGGVSVTRSCADTEGPHPGAHCWVVASGVSVRSERGRASAERLPTRRAKQSHAVKQKKTAAPGPRGKTKPPRSGK
jgi:hypothetical protein